MLFIFSFFFIAVIFKDTLFSILCFAYKFIYIFCRIFFPFSTSKNNFFLSVREVKINSKKIKLPSIILLTLRILSHCVMSAEIYFFLVVGWYELLFRRLTCQDVFLNFQFSFYFNQYIRSPSST